jgi:hypothetical protein
MAVSDLQLEPEAVKEIAKLRHDALIATQAKLLDEHSASYRWLMASLLAINIGALAMIKEAIVLNPARGIASVVFFCVGIGFALLIAVLGQKANQKMLKPISEAVELWGIISITGQYVDEVEKRISNEINSASRQPWPRRFGVLSFVAFLCGVGFFGASLWLQGAVGNPQHFETANSAHRSQ